MDLLRGLAALAVMVGHLRALYFNGWNLTPTADGLVRFFYWMTHLENIGVKVFFVLSGFWIGGSVVRSIRKGGWSWRRYLELRLSRLYTVLLPALLLVFLLDSWGKLHGDPLYFRGAKIGLNNFLNNLFFLQEFHGSVYGTDGPLWSLSCEFWYYLLFPAIFLGFQRKTVVWKKCLAGFVVAIIAFEAVRGSLSQKSWEGAFIWLLGMMAYCFLNDERFGKWVASPLFFTTALLLFVVGLWPTAVNVGGGKWGVLFGDMMLSVGCAGVLPYLARRDWLKEWYVKTTTYLSEISYTLYLVHFPLLVFILFGFGKRGIAVPSLETLPIFAALFIAVLIFSRFFWYLFERRTSDVRHWIEKKEKSGL
jgi:peptidoglycan/LPS O-acetylase OafA/YrhL